MKKFNEMADFLTQCEFALESLSSLNASKFEQLDIEHELLCEVIFNNGYEEYSREEIGYINKAFEDYKRLVNSLGLFLDY